MRFFRFFILVGLIMLVMAGCGGFGLSWPLPGDTTPAGSGQPPTVPGLNSGVEAAQVQAAVMELLIGANRIRLAAGQPPLVANSQLMAAAQERAADMADLGYFDHVHPQRGTAEIERLLRSAFPEARLAELVYLDDCAVQELPTLTLEAWMADEANRSALLDPSFNLIGVGTEHGSAGWYTVLTLSE